MVRRISMFALTITLLLALVLPAVPAMAQQGTLADLLTQLRESDPSYSEHFRRDNGLWELDLDSEKSTIRLESGSYRVGALEPNLFVWGIGEVTAQDLYVEVDATRVEGPLDNEYGIVFRHVDTENYYVYLVSSDGYYALRKLEEGEWVDILPWAKTDQLDIDEDATNRIGVFAQGNQIALIINEQVVDAVQDDTFSGGQIALAAGSFEEAGVEIAFDNLDLWDLEELGIPLVTDIPVEEPVAEPTTEPDEQPELDADAVAARVEELRQATPDFSDSFRSDQGSWGLEGNESVEYQIKNRQLTIQVNDPDWMGWSVLGDSASADMLFEADMRLVDGPVAAEHGIVFRYQDDNNFYFFAVNSESSWSLWELVDDEWSAILNWQTNNALESGVDSINRLTVLAEGDLITLMINDVPVGQARDDTFAGGEVALAVGTFEDAGAKVAFDNVDYWILSEMSEEPVETPVPLEIIQRLDDIAATEPTTTSEFRRDYGSWDNVPDDDVTKTYEQRALHVRVDRMEWVTWSVHQKISAADFLAEVETSLIDAPASSEYGLVFRLTDQDFYFFAISSNGYYSLARSDDGEWSDLVPWTESNLIATGAGAANLLAVLAEGPVITLIVNGEALTQVEDDTYSVGEVGLAVGTFDEAGVEVAFDNFRYWQLDEGG